MTTPAAVAVALTRAGWHHDTTTSRAVTVVDTWNHSTAGTVKIETGGDSGRVGLHIVYLTPEQVVEALSGAGLIHSTGGARVRHAVAALDAARVRHPDEALTALVIYQRNGGGLSDAEQVEVIGHYVNPDSDADRQVAHDCRIRCGNAQCGQCFPTLPVIDASGDRP